MKLISNAVFFSSLIIILILNSGCPEASSTGTIAPSTCPSELISITGNATKGGSTNNWVVTINLTATCAGPPVAPLAGAQIRLTYLGTNYIVTTNTGGTYSQRFPPATGNPSGNRFTATVKGSDGVEVSSGTITVP